MGPEMLLQYMWEYRLWNETRARTVDGTAVSVIDPGRRNNGSGPDFFNAKINLGGHMWAGNVEIHNRASDWHRHGHDTDTAYDTVILHVVAESDCDIRRPDGSVIPQMVMPYVPDFRERYLAMVQNTASKPPCAADLASTAPIYITQWITALGFERINAKADRVRLWLRQFNGDWQTTAFVTVARALGFGTNSDPFELLARITPLRHLLRHSNQPDLLAAALYGQAGFLDKPLDDVEDPDDAEYMERLRRHYNFLLAKYNWSTANRPAWRMARMRPANFPHRRIAALAALLADGFPFSRAFQSVTSLAQARNLFHVSLPPYWTDHYDFGRRSSAMHGALSTDSVNTLIINTVIPLMYAYAEAFADESISDRALELLHALPAEFNYIVRDFTSAGLPVPDAFTSQALIQLHNEYCAPRKCIFCRLGRRYLAARASPR